MHGGSYLTAREVAEALGVSVATVYAYVSRGLLHSEPSGAGDRSRRYLADDVRKLRERKEYRRDPSRAAGRAMDWGMPILETALTQIVETGPRYRGRDAAELARAHTIEQVAALLWTGDMEDCGTIFHGGNRPIRTYREEVGRLGLDLPPLHRAHLALALASAEDLAGYDLDLQGDAIARTGARILRLMAAVVADEGDPCRPIAPALLEGWGLSRVRTSHLLDAALILCADHELAASSFTARVVASAGAQLHLVVMAALAALQGFRHGGNTGHVEALLREIGEPGAARRVVAERLRRGAALPGFGHPLYPAGDPRASALLDLTAETDPDSPALALSRAVAATVQEVTGRSPNVDFALVTLVRTLGLPPGSALTLFALGRTVGWIAHAIEQYRQGQLLRPRAVYRGP
ncbi:MAG: citrate synthase family protein [Chloroflexi bacterium]|nr:citrate synthase family protein [Chloroflexota bacterium]